MEICPYCHKKIQEIVTPYSHEYEIYGYRFWCDCRNKEEDQRYDEKEAYQIYLRNIKGSKND